MSEYENFNDPAIYIHEELLSNNFSIVSNYLKLLNTYHILFNKNIVTKKIHYIDFIYKQGMKCLNHIFIILLHYTNNINFAYYHCEKGIYYFTEFISQIENENSFLKLSSIDAIIFVYKKTIYNINKKMASISRKDNIEEINKIIKLINLINTYKNYDELSPFYVKLINLNEEQISRLYKSIDDNTILQALKNEL